MVDERIVIILSRSTIKITNLTILFTVVGNNLFHRDAQLIPRNLSN
jgi:hypothetical protein